MTPQSICVAPDGIGEIAAADDGSVAEGSGDTGPGDVGLATAEGDEGAADAAAGVDGRPPAAVQPAARPAKATKAITAATRNDQRTCKLEPRDGCGPVARRGQS
jgi:hypothetical protein